MSVEQGVHFLRVCLTALAHCQNNRLSIILAMTQGQPTWLSLRHEICTESAVGGCSGASVAAVRVAAPFARVWEVWYPDG